MGQNKKLKNKKYINYQKLNKYDMKQLRINRERKMRDIGQRKRKREREDR